VAAPRGIIRSDPRNSIKLPGLYLQKKKVSALCLSYIASLMSYIPVVSLARSTIPESMSTSSMGIRLPYLFANSKVLPSSITFLSTIRIQSLRSRTVSPPAPILPLHVSTPHWSTFLGFHPISEKAMWITARPIDSALAIDKTLPGTCISAAHNLNPCCWQFSLCERLLRLVKGHLTKQ
jgi:hypothetical protein